MTFGLFRILDISTLTIAPTTLSSQEGNSMNLPLRSRVSIFFRDSCESPFYASSSRNYRTPPKLQFYSARHSNGTNSSSRRSNEASFRSVKGGHFPFVPKTLESQGAEVQASEDSTQCSLPSPLRPPYVHAPRTSSDSRSRRARMNSSAPILQLHSDLKRLDEAVGGLRTTRRRMTSTAKPNTSRKEQQHSAPRASTENRVGLENREVRTREQFTNGNQDHRVRRSRRKPTGSSEMAQHTNAKQARVGPLRSGEKTSPQSSPKAPISVNRSSQASNDTDTASAAAIQKRRREEWQIQKESLQSKFPAGWSPFRRLSPEALDGIRALHAQYPDLFTTPVLADRFKVSPEAIRRILKSKWQPTTEEEEERRHRWERRGQKIWKGLVKKGVHPPKKWRQMGIGAGPRKKGHGRSELKKPKKGKKYSENAISWG